MTSRIDCLKKQKNISKNKLNRNRQRFEISDYN